MALEGRLLEHGHTLEGRLLEHGGGLEGRLVEQDMALEGRLLKHGGGLEGHPVEVGETLEGRLPEPGGALEGRIVEPDGALEGRLGEAGVFLEGRLSERGALEGRLVEPGALEGRLEERGEALEGRPDKLGLYDRNLREVEVDKGGAGEVEADVRPEVLLGRGWEELGLLGGGLRRAAEVAGEEALGGLADLQLLPDRVASRSWMRCLFLAVGRERRLLHPRRVQLGLS
jgi:hypothetical protein